jgi:hypothetical protein
MWYGLLADVVVAFHLCYVCFVVFGQLAIFLGMFLRWNWIRNFWFRVVHLTMITVVAVEAILNISCPLTTWEARLRELAGEEAAEGTFVGRLLDKVVFYNFPAWAFTTLYIGFALLVAASFWLAPPRPPWRRRPTVPGSAVRPSV